MHVAELVPTVQPSLPQARSAAVSGPLPSGSGRISAVREPDDPRLVAIGGGTGLPAVLEGLCGRSAGHPPIDPDDVTAIVTVTDDGGSSGKLRSQFGVLPP